MDIVKSTKSYEAWLRAHLGRRKLTLIKADLEKKHAEMADAPFPFLRATFYHWARAWRAACPSAARAPKVLGVGDLHVENFGTWRDIEGRLVWGINDFDEAFPLPYTNDLIRLATSAIIAHQAGDLRVAPKVACAAILHGYREAIAGSEPFVLADNKKLESVAIAAERASKKFWSKLKKEKAVIPSADVRAILKAALPYGAEPDRYVHRDAGLGSLGRPRYCAIAAWQGGRVAREAKAMAPSAVAWAARFEEANHYSDLASRAVRAADPCLAFVDGWVVRRLGPHCSRMKLCELPKDRHAEDLLRAMGSETANAHLGSRQQTVRDIQKHAKAGSKAWLYDAASRTTDVTYADWKAWRKYWN